MRRLISVVVILAWSMLWSDANQRTNAMNATLLDEQLLLHVASAKAGLAHAKFKAGAEAAYVNACVTANVEKAEHEKFRIQAISEYGKMYEIAVGLQIANTKLVKQLNGMSRRFHTGL